METVILTEQELTFAYDSDRGANVNNSNPSLFLPVEGETYVVVWDETEYTCVAYTNEAYENMVILGNPVYLGGTDTGEPFIFASIADGSGMTIFTTDTAETHVVSVYQENAGKAKSGASIVLYDRTGQAVTYEGVETITTDTPVDGERATFTHGVLLDGTEIELDMAAGDQEVSVPDGYLVKKATLKKPETLLPEHIKKGIDVAGVIGTFAGDEKEKTVDLAMADGDQVIDADVDTVMTKVTVRKPETLVPENIADGVNVGGVVGTYKAVQAPHQLIDGSSESFEIIDESFDIAPTAIKANAFSGNTGITKAVMSEVKTIGNSAFYSCQNLSEVSFERCESIGNSAFDRCRNLVEAAFPACTKIGSYAFELCDNVSAMNFSNLVECGTYAFGSCSALREINIEKMTSLPQGMFDYCSNLQSIVFASEISCFGMYAIRGTAYYSNIAERENNVLYVNNVAVSGLSKTGITGTLVFREGTTCVGGDGFYWNSKITAISCSTMKWIGASAFRSCSSITTIDMPEVLEVGAAAFQSCYKLSGVDFPKCLSVGSTAFQYCSSMTAASFSMCESVGFSAFQYCSSMTAAYFPACKTVGAGAFQYCYKLPSVDFPNCTMVNSNAFYSCSALVEVNLPACKYIGSYAFYTCKSLTTISLPSCSYISASAFYSCNALTTISLPSCSYIGSSAFQHCYSLTEVYLPVCSYIGNSAFANCSALQTLVLGSASVCNLASSYVLRFTSIYNGSGYIYVPSSLIASYKANIYWKYFSARFSAIEDMEV